MTNAQSGGGHEHPAQGIPSTEEDALHADRDVARQELGETIDALARKADLPSRSRQAAHGYIVKAQDGATTLARAVRHSRASEMAWLPPAALAAVVALGSALVLAKSRSRARRPGHRGYVRR
ncbi:DUF3618 domain-containing protein [Haloactinomyces albus]|uniref:Primosomal protein N n=1 Tax=Haloactinomyces albus TaxID=1352928 RepID=A0AAE4CJZ0_9ACTN|nr:DUF3618 domain-containing protein [Haloactinomyces albus]MDR7300219.1 primosomal protein N'' [Haloactinomyces albus]